MTSVSKKVFSIVLSFVIFGLKYIFLVLKSQYELKLKRILKKDLSSNTTTKYYSFQAIWFSCSYNHIPFECLLSKSRQNEIPSRAIHWKNSIYDKF